jgi:hypothetical protein
MIEQKHLRITTCVCVLLATAPFARAERWEIGGAVGYPFVRESTITRDGASAKAGLASTPAFSIYGSHSERRLIGGDFWYTYRPGDLELSSSSTKVTFDSSSHLIHYDITIHPRRGESRFEPYIAAGGGIRVISGRGRESSFQGLNSLAVLSRTREVLPLLSLAVGVRAKVSDHVSVRLELRDNITPFPGRVISVNPRATSGSWWHDLTPQAGLGVVF